MELQWSKQACPYIKTQFRQMQPLEQTQELRLPDEYPDISRVLCAWGQPMIRSKEWRGDCVIALGGIHASVAYWPEDGSGIRIMETWIPFQSRWNIALNGYEGALRTQCVLRGMDARMVSARKMMLRANLALWAEALEPAEAELVTLKELNESVEVLTNLYPAVIPKELGEKQFALEEEFQMPEASQWISFSVEPDLTEQNVIGNRAVIRGQVRLHYVYLDHDGQIKNGDSALAYAQFLELNHDYDKEATVDVVLCLAGLEHEMTPDGVRIQCSLTAQYLVWNRELLELLEDAYSNHNEISIERENITLPMQLDDRMENVNFFAELPEGKLIDMVFHPDFPVVNREGDTATIDLSGTFQLLYMDEAGDIQSLVQNTVQTLNYPVAEECMIIIQVEGIAVKEHSATVNVRLQTCIQQELSMISGLSVGDTRPTNQNMPAIILRRMDTDSLWLMAKETGSTMSAIRQANQLTEDPVCGQMLLIPIN